MGSSNIFQKLPSRLFCERSGHKLRLVAAAAGARGRSEWVRVNPFNLSKQPRLNHNHHRHAGRDKSTGLRDTLTFLQDVNTSRVIAMGTRVRRRLMVLLEQGRVLALTHRHTHTHTHISAAGYRYLIEPL